MKREYFILRDGIKINISIKDNKASKWLIVTHGVSEHHERHLYLEELFGKKLNYFFYDLRGHGHSTGHPQYIDDFSDYALDLEELLKFLKDEYGMIQYLLYGHSMGALITSDFLKNVAKEDFYPELVYLSSPPISAGGKLGEIALKAPIALYDFLINLPLSIRLKILPGGNLSHDPAVNKAAEDDPLACNGMHTKLSFETMKKAREIYSSPINPKCPAFISIGTGDKIVSPEGAINYFKNIETNFELKIIENAYHEIHFETEQYRRPFINFLTAAFEKVI